MAKALRERVGQQYKGTQRTRKAVHGECTVELAKWTLPIISLCREPYEAKVSRTGLTGGLGRRAVRLRALILPTYLTPTRDSEVELPEPSLAELARVIKAGTCIEIYQSCNLHKTLFWQKIDSCVAKPHNKSRVSR